MTITTSASSVSPLEVSVAVVVVSGGGGGDSGLSSHCRPALSQPGPDRRLPA